MRERTYRCKVLQKEAFLHLGVLCYTDLVAQLNRNEVSIWCVVFRF